MLAIVKSSVRITVLGVFCAGVSCSGGGGKNTTPTAPPPVLTTVSVTLSAATVQVGQTAQADAARLDQSGASIATGSVTWSSSAPTVATISAAGSITTLLAGQTTITALAGGRSGQATLTVVPVPVTRVIVTPPTVSLIAGATQQLTATTLDAGGAVLSGRVVIWSTSDATKASVNATGFVTAVFGGAVTITATSEGKSGSAQIVVTFPTTGPDGIAFAGTTGNLSWPVPDPAIAVGSDRMLLITNSEVVIATKAGTTVDRVTLQSFFTPVLAAGERSQGDVSAVFDEASGRFFLAEAANLHPQPCVPGTCVGHNLIAVSKTATPASLGPDDWYLYAIDRFLERSSTVPTPTTIWADYDDLAVTHDALIVTSRRYGELDGLPKGAIIRILDKAKLIAGELPATWTDLVAPAGAGINAGVMPARVFGASSVQFFVSRALDGSCGWTVWGVTGGLSAPSVVTQTVPWTGNCTVPRYGPQLSGAPPLDVGGSGSLARTAVVRNGRLWMAETWGQNVGAGTGTAIKWAELDVSQWPNVTAVQQGTVGADGEWSFYPAIMVDPAGTMVLAFNTTSATTYPSIKVAMRYASDPVGTMRPSTIIKAGSGASVHLDDGGRNRYGDYLSMELDPATFALWLHGQYGTAGNSQTWVAQIKP